jgi:hypothetical protein
MPSKQAESRRPDIEKKLSDGGFSWEYRTNIPFDAFDFEKSLRNQARIGAPLNEATVERYEAGIVNGDLFPAIIANEPRSNARLVVVDGNHRFAARMRHRKSIDAYVIVGAQQQAITMLTFEANTTHGLATSAEERTHHALWLADGGVPLTEAAKRMGLSITDLRKASNLVVAGHRADDAGILRTQWDAIPDAGKLRLHQISTDEGFKALTELSVAAGLSVKEIGELVTPMNEQRSSTKQVALVKELRSDLADRIQVKGVGHRGPIGRQGRSPRQALGMSLGQIASLPSDQALIQYLTDEEKGTYAKRVDEAMARLVSLHAALIDG